MRDATLTAQGIWWRRTEAQPELPARAADGSAGRLPFIALLCFTFVLMTGPQTWFPALAPLRLALVAAGAAVAFHVLNRFTRRLPVVEPIREMAIAGCLVAWALVTIPFSYWPVGSVMFLLDAYLKTLITFWLVSSVVDSRPRLRQIVWTLVLTSIPIAFVAIRNYQTGVFVDGAAAGVRRIVGYQAPLTGNPNDLALTINLILPFAVGLYFSNRSFARRALLLGVIALGVTAVLLTYSRGGFLTLMLIALLYLGKLTRRFGAIALLVALALGMSLVLLPSSYTTQMGTIMNMAADPTGSAQERWSDMVTAVRLVLEHPIVGSGVGMNVLALNAARGSTWMPVHNVYLQYAVELGLPGLLLFLALFWSCFKRARAVRRLGPRAPGDELFHLAESIEVSLLAFAAAACFHPAGYNFYFYYPAGLAIALHRVRAQEGES